MAIRIEVDRVLCQGHGVCESEAPAVFEVGRVEGSSSHQVIVIDESPAEDLRGGIDLAVKYCPTHALKIVED